MAKIYPERPPQSIIDDPGRRDELIVFNALKDLPERYRIFYSMHWQGFNRFQEVNEGEADFVIVHPDQGIIVLEVKGGGITYNADHDQWYSQSLGGVTHRIKDPIIQARNSHYEIRDRLEELPGWPNRKINIWHAVCFPDVYLKAGQFLKPDLPREAVLDADDLKDITNNMRRLFTFFFGENMRLGVPGNDRMQMIEGLLANSFEIRSPLSVELDFEDQKLIELTEQQFRALSLLGDRKRAAISGCAGSGKTMLAAKKAQQFADLGMSVLLVCYNIALAQDLSRKLPGVEVYNFHELCKQAARQTGFSLRSISDQQEYYDQYLPEVLLESAEKIGRIYDAIIIDEGQDFQESYWIALEALLKEDAYLYIFFDNNQNLYGGFENFSGLISEAPFPLNQNCRNTKSIHEVVAKFHNKPESLVCFSPPGREPETITCNGKEDMLRQLQKLLYRLVVEEHIFIADIVILTPRGETKTRLTPGLKLGSFTLTDHYPSHQSRIQATSIFKFKGLERKVVIMTEIDGRTQYNRDMVMYVGCSRARTELILLTDETAPQQIMERVNADT
jgi:hypothetical protein